MRKRNWVSVISVAGLTIIAVSVIVSAAYEIMLPTRERSFTHVVEAGDTPWSIANKHFPAGKTSLCFDEFRCLVDEQISKQTNTKYIQPGQTIKVVWKDKF